MPPIIDNINLDETNAEFNFALDFVKHTNKLVYLTGKAGTGKTTFLKHLRQTTDKSTVILAPTGVAAINAGGQTINSFFQLPFGPFVLNDIRLRTGKNFGDTDDTTIYSTFKYKDHKKHILQKLELLIIDEISMVRCDTLDVIDRILRVFRKKLHLPFGGVQVVLIGDTFQLPPIAKFEQWEILKHHYESPFFFSSKVFKENKPVYIEFKKIYRQKEQEFVDLLNKIRTNQINDIELNELNKKYNPVFTSGNSNNHIILSTTNSEVNHTNARKLEELGTATKIFQSELIGVFPKDSKGDFVLPTEQNLHLKVGAQVMILKNDAGEYKRYFNGKIGIIDSLEESKIVIRFADESKVQIEKTSWENIQYTWNDETQRIEETVVGTFTQYPLRLAWAITVHKSQGLTFENVYADLGSAFEDGQVYVALSRCTSLNGLVLKSKIAREKISTNKKVLEFAKTETPHTLVVEELTSGKADYYYQKVRENIKASNFIDAYNDFIKAIKFRNDIETEAFKKYFVTTAYRLASHKTKLENAQKNFEKIIEENENHKSSIFTLENENLELKTKMEIQKDQFRFLLDNQTAYDKSLEQENNKYKELEQKYNELKANNEKYIAENSEQKAVIAKLIKASENTDIAEFIANNFIYEKSPRGFETRKYWFDSLDSNWRNSWQCSLGFDKIKYYKELLDIFNNNSELSICGIENIEPIKFLTNLTSLRLISLNAPTYTGDLYGGAVDLTPVSYLTNLDNLELANFTTWDFTPLKYLYNLKKITIRQVGVGICEYDGGIRPSLYFLRENAKLETIKITNCNLDSLETHGNFPNIKELILHDNNIADISDLVCFYNLEVLDLSKNKLEISNFDMFDCFGSNLRELYLNETGIKYLSTECLDTLKKLELRGNLITDTTEVLWNLSKLEELDLSKNPISNFRGLEYLNNLKTLNLSNIGTIELKYLLKLNNLSQLILDGNEIIDIELLLEMKQLEKLSLLGSNMTVKMRNILKSVLTKCDIVFDESVDYDYDLPW